MMLTVFLAIAIRAVKPVFVRMVITRLCYFFNMISQKVIDKSELGSLQAFMAETMAQLEMCFPPSFFDIMPHLIVHMVDQIRALGPCYLHEMWTYERFMSTLNRYVLNRACPEGSMIEAYSTEEVVECCQDYLKDKKGIGLVASHYAGRLGGKGTRGKKTFIDNNYYEVDKAHYSVLQQLAIMSPYIDEHINLIRAEGNGRSEAWIMKEHKSRFTKWLMAKDIPEGGSEEEVTMKRLGVGPSAQVTKWEAYVINGYTFYTIEKDKKSVCQNSGVRIEAVDNMGETVTYYGFIEEIWELDYGLDIQIPVFKCHWVKHPQGVEVDNYGLTIVDLANVGYKDDPWVLGSRVAQVLYVLDPSSKKQKHIVVPGKQSIIGVDSVEDVGAHNEYENMNLFTDLPTKIKHVEAAAKDDTPWLRKGGEPKIVTG